MWQSLYWGNGMNTTKASTQLTYVEINPTNLLSRNTHTSPHTTCIDKTRLLEREENYTKQRIREVVEIEKRNNILNRDDGLKLSSSWKSVIDKLKRSHNQ